MKLQVMSDLHLEFHRDNGISFIDSMDSTDVDVLVLAGDIAPLRDHYWLNNAFDGFCDKYKHVVYVPGNHEYYGTSTAVAEQNLSIVEMAHQNLHILRDGQPIVIGGKRFIGGTLWFREIPNARVYGQQMNDFHVIDGFEPWVYAQNKLVVDGLTSNLSPDDIVVTHHLPSQQSVHRKFRMSSLNPFFVCELDQLIVARKPKLWIHGHTHEACDHVVGTTRVLANPHGYPRESIETPFNPKLVLDI